MNDRPSPFAMEVLLVLKNACENPTNTRTAEYIHYVMCLPPGDLRRLSQENVYQALESLRWRGLCEEAEIRPGRWEWKFVKLPDKPNAPTSEQGRLF